MSKCKHEFEWWGEDTSRCTICGLVVPDVLTTILENNSNFYASAKEWLEELVEERNDYIKYLRDIEQGCGPADTIAKRVLEKYSKSTQ